MKAFYILVCVVFLNLNVFSQEANNRKLWSKEELVYSDFWEKPIDHSPFVSELQYIIGYEYKTRNVSGINYTSFVVSSYVDRNISWIKPEGKTINTLIYCQTIFNIAELYARKLEKKLNNLVIDENQENLYVHELFNTYLDSCNKVISLFKGETSYGIKESIVMDRYNESWEKLKSLPRTKLPDYDELNKAWGMDIGLGYGVLKGEISESLNNHIDFLNYGFMYNRNNLYYDLRFLIGTHKAKKEFKNKEYSLAKDTGSLVVFVDLSIGYQVLNGHKFSAYPFAGLTLMQMSRTNKIDKKAIEGPYNIHPVLGMQFNYWLKTPSLNTNLKTNIMLKARVTYEPINYVGALNGNSIRVYLGVGIDLESIKLKD